MANEDFPDFPKTAHGEVPYQVARTTLGAADLAFPLIGQALQLFADHLVGSPLEKRRAAWFNKVAEKLQNVPDDLLNNEDFVSTIIDATFAAMKTKFEEKREALANAVANMAIGFDLDEVLRGAFIAYVDRFSPQHLSVLRLLDNPVLDMVGAKKAVELLNDSREGVLGGPRIPSEEDLLLVRVLTDLSREGLISASLNQSATTPDEALKRTTKIGEMFIAFISDPPSL